MRSISRRFGLRGISFGLLLIGVVAFSVIYIMSVSGRTSDSSSCQNCSPVAINNQNDVPSHNMSAHILYGTLGGENHAWMTYFGVYFDHSYAYVGENVYIDVTAYNNDAGIFGANLYVKYKYKDKNGVVTLTENSAERYVSRGSSYAFPRVTKSLGGPVLPWTGGGAQDRIEVELWWNDGGTHRLQHDGVWAQFPVLAHLYFHGVGGHGIDTNGDTLYDGVQCESMIWTDGGSTPITIKGYLHDMYDSQQDSDSQDFTINDNQNTWLFGPNLHVKNGNPKGQYHWYMEVYDKYTGLLEATTLNQYINPLYPPDYHVHWTIYSNPPGLIIRIDGLDNTAPVTCSWKVASTHTLYALSPQSGGTGIRYVWTSWSDGGAQSHTVGPIPDADDSRTANFNPQYYLTVSSAYGSTGGQGWYDSGTNAYATVTPLTVPGGSGTQYVFTQWSGDASGSTSPSNPIYMNGPKTAVANWKTQHWLTVSSPYGSIGGQGWYDYGTYAYATVNPLTVPGGSGTQYVFTQWSGDASGSTSPSNAIYMNGPKTANANWKTQYQHTITSSPATGSGYVTVDGSPITTPYTTPWWDSGSPHMIAANSPVTIVPGQSQYAYSSWSDYGAQSHPVSPTAVTTYTANFQLQYYFGVSSAYDSPTGQGWYNSGSLLIGSTVTRPVSGGVGIQYETTGWTGTGSLSSGGSSGSSSTYSFTITAYSTCTWNWKTQYYLTVSSPYGTTGGQGWYDSGTNAYATVNPLTVPGGSGTQYVFTQWSGDASGSSSPSNAIYMNGPKTAVANWKTQYYLTVSSPYGTTGGQAWYDSGATAYATVTPPIVPGPSGTQYVFTYWSGDASGSTSPSNPIYMDRAKTATANWKTQYYLTVSSAYGTTGGQGWYDSGTNAYATVTPLTVSGGSGTQYVFTQWSGDASGSSSPSNAIYMNGPKTANANWKTQYQHTITSSPATGSGYLTVDGSPITTPYTTPWWDSGSPHMIAANSPVTIVPGQSQYAYSSWSDYGAQSHPVSPTAVTTYTASFQLQYFLSVTGGDGSGAGWYNNGVQASSTASYVLDQVIGQSRNNLYQKTVDGTPISLTRANSSTATHQFTMSTYHSIVWSYYTQYYLTVVGGNSISFGTASPTGDNWYDSGTSTTVSSNWVWNTVPSQSRTAITNYAIDGANQNPTRQGTGTLTTSPVVMNVYHTVAFASITQYYLAVSTNPPSLSPPPTVSPIGYNLWYDEGVLVTCEAQNVIGFAFGNWTVDGINQGSGVNPIGVVMDGPHNAIAHYTGTGVHDVAVIDIAHSRNYVGQGYNCTINATVSNEGNFEETFNVTIHANTTEIGRQTVTLTNGSSTTVSFAWNTTGFVKGNYTISAYAWPILGETNTTDNILTDGWILITKIGDLGGPVDGVPTFFAFDGKVDGYDLALFITCYKGQAGNAQYLGDLGGPVNYVPTFFKIDGKVDGYDLALFIACYKGLGP